MSNTRSAFVSKLDRLRHPPIPVVPASLVRPAPLMIEGPKPITVIVRKVDTDILPPDTKVKLAPDGVPLAKQVILAAEVASQIRHQELIGRCRTQNVVRWRWALYFALRELFPTMSGKRASILLNRDHTTMLHAAWVKQRNPKLLRDKIAAIMEVLV